ncbi:MAG TPA: protease complex subunit PrcB family protein [Gammaproteobacteria bacterium]|nr:protease complex subunit PrcB family protein [Gammaproteobacteria bacterium]
MNKQVKWMMGGAALALLLAGCASLGGDSNVQLLASGSHSGVKEQEYHDLHNAKDFQTWWNKAYSSYSEVPALPQVDFSKNMVIAAFMGEKSHGGYTIRIHDIELTPDAYNVDIRITIPGNKCRASQAIIQPFEFVVVPNNNGQFINWNVKQSNKPC